MTAPKLIVSTLSCVVEENGDRIEIAIYRLDDGDWKLEIFAVDGSTLWEEPFDSEEAALAEALIGQRTQVSKAFSRVIRGRTR